MRKNNKQVKNYFIILALLLIGVVYAILQAYLQINGIAKIKSNSWDIHFDNIQINENSVAIGDGDSAATIDPENNCKVDFEVTLSLPGDFYEFTVDVVNAGTIDAMIGELNKTLKVNGEAVSEVPEYLNYTVTYEDGIEIVENHGLSAGSTETYLVRLEFRSDIEELPDVSTISMILEPEYIQADTNVIPVNHPFSLYSVFETELLSGDGFVHEYTGSHKDSFTTTGTEKIYHWYAMNEDMANEVKDKWNVIFGGFCWQMIRTTDTGGVKIIYNGVSSDGHCTATGTEQQIVASEFNTPADSPAYVGYMYNPNTLITFKGWTAATSGSLFGTGVTYSNGTYTLTSTSTTYDDNHHYTCNNTTGKCSTVRYYYYDNCYVELDDGRVNIKEILDDMLNADNVNQTNSTIKTAIDTWYQNNMTAYTSKLEDTIFCNNRAVSNYAGWNPNGGSKNAFLRFNTSNDLICTNTTDQFSMNNSKAQLTYPIGLLTGNEVMLLNNTYLTRADVSYWLGNAYSFDSYALNLYVYLDGVSWYGTRVQGSYGVRPAVSLMPGTIVISGDGSKNNPYIVE
ncbi:MAG: hypothetical protein IJG68_06855 [Bacilli bacterium]|nr:hypothetical protein [Bacilli bacterium]